MTKITHKVMMERDFIDDIICNKCGESCMNENSPSPEGLVEVSVQGGYGSEVLGDGEQFVFSVCEKCLGRFMMDFVVHPTYLNILDHGADFDDWRKDAIARLKQAWRG